MPTPDNPLPLSDAEALEISRKYLNWGQLVYKWHFRKQLDQRNISLQDAIHVIENGRIAKKPEWDYEHGEFHYSIVGKTIEGVDLTLVIAISKKDDMLIIITAF